ncbi:MAG: hypothetical protein ACRC4N_06150, partial [Gammaproteobacteria bacterium]
NLATGLNLTQSGNWAESHPIWQHWTEILETQVFHQFLSCDSLKMEDEVRPHVWQFGNTGNENTQSGNWAESHPIWQHWTGSHPIWKLG